MSKRTNPIIKKFDTEYAKAAGVSKVVASSKIDLSTYTSDKALKRGLKEYANDLAAKLAKSGLKPEDTPNEVINLLTMLSNLKVEDDMLDCREPLAGGTITFDDIAGLSDVKSQMEVNYIQPARYPLLFPAIGKGILLYGIPGGGKTLLARAATAEIEGVAYFAPSAGELRGKYEGETEKNISAIFECAQQALDEENSPYKLAIIFFDEFDSIGGKRTNDPSMTRSVNALLQNMDGIKNRPHLSVIAATNFPWSLDDAILRRFTSRIFVDLPDETAREYIIRDVLAKIYSDPTLDEKQRRESIGNGNVGFTLNAGYMKNIETLGEYTGIAQSVGYLRTTQVIEDSNLTNKYIDTLVDIFGPTDAGQNIIDAIKGGKPVKDDDSRLNVPEHIFGYSPSDITKIMEMAVKLAATRVLDGYVRPHKFGKETYYVATSDTSQMKVTSLKSDEERRKVVNFSIRESDVKLAIKSLSSTVDNFSYVQLLKYSRQA